MRQWLCLLAYLPWSVLGAGLDIPDQVKQGELVIGRAPSGSVINLGTRQSRVGRTGVFALGIAYDAPSQLALDVTYADGRTERRELSVAQRDYKIERVDGLPQHTVTPDPQLAARIAEEQARVAKARERDDDRDDLAVGFIQPASGRISGVYGSQRIDNGVAKSPHMGLDIAVRTGTPVKVPAAGIVTFAESGLVLTGGTVLIDHGHGVSSSFLHLSRIDVVPGQRVERGQIFAAAGATGRASGPHVHWGLNWFDVRLDPALLQAPAAR